MNCSRAKEIDLVNYLAKLGYFAAFPPRGSDYWYLSPLRIEHTPSFHVDRNKNVWYDHGCGYGGTIIDFGCAYFNCSISDFLKKLNETISISSSSLKVENGIEEKLKQKEKKIKVFSTHDITSPALLHYLKVRKIPLLLAQAFCCEVNYDLYNKHYFAIGFKNDNGGYELRNSYFKGSAAPKGTTFINRGSKKVEVFEGFFSFLSYLLIQGDCSASSSNFLVLNSLAFFKKSTPLMEEHEIINLNLDRDTQGIKFATEALHSRKYIDASVKYDGCKDWNNFLVKNKNTVKYQNE